VGEAENSFTGTRRAVKAGKCRKPLVGTLPPAFGELRFNRVQILRFSLEEGKHSVLSPVRSQLWVSWVPRILRCSISV